MPAPKKSKPRPLSQCLSTAHWFAQKLGFNNSDDMLATMRDAGEGQVLDYLLTSNKMPQIPPALLRGLDENITNDLARINRRRRVPITLKYFQYLAVLAAEYTLHRLVESPENLAHDINESLYGADNRRSMPEVLPEHLNKLAFWMATGGGKTLIMHLNILQFRRYQHGIFAPDNVLIITPNETMTAQHRAELRASDIPARLFSERGGMFGDSVVVLDIHKLSDKKGKKGITLPPETFTGRNLIFVDEGHKGSGGGDKGYFDKRDRLVKNGGFAFEYSATFGQAIAVAGDIKRAKEYGRAILFDYSYRHFYDDDYGKDFFVLNAAQENDRQDRLMFANLLSFFQQQLAWQEHPAVRNEYQIEKPLLLMLGATVTGGKKPSNDDSNTRTDIITIANFLRRVIADKDKNGKAWTDKMAREIVGGKSGIKNDDGEDLFADKFAFLQKKYSGKAADLCAKMRALLFHHAQKGVLQFRPLVRGKANGQHPEIALQVSGAENPFALIYVGNSNKLVEMAKADDFAGINEFMRQPLFPHINNAESPINILVGAKKFMEGWSSWRVCSIGLLNVGKSEGPLIIQLFGRGVRLQGKKWSLKRSKGANLHGNAQTAVQILEMLNIFAVRAEFMGQFREYLKREGTSSEQITLPVFSNLFADKKLHYPQPAAANKPNKNGDFGQSDKVVILRPDNKIKITIDLTSRYVAAAGGNVPVAATAEESPTLEFAELLPKINVNNLYFRMQEYVASCGWRNAVIFPALLREMLGKCNIKPDAADDGTPNEMLPGNRLQHIAFLALKQYADKVYGKARRLWEKENMGISRLQIDGENKHGNFADYTLYLQDAAAKTVREIKDAVEKWKQEGQNKKARIKGSCFFDVYFDRHLAQPLLSEKTKARLSPLGLNDGEKRFVDYMRAFVESDNSRGLLDANAEIFLLRNLPKNGVGLTLEDGSRFYPDFMLWILDGKRERLVFVDPKGLQNFSTADSHKSDIWKYLHEISAASEFQKKKFQMDSFLVSVTPYDEIGPAPGGEKSSKAKMQEKHILFLEDLTPATSEAAKHSFTRLLKPNA